MTSTTTRGRILAGAAEQLSNHVAREQLRTELRQAGYPANAFLADLAAGHPMQVVLRRYGYNPITRQHPGDRHPSNLAASRPRPGTVTEQMIAGFRRTGR